MRGIPIRIEMGPRDIEANQAVIVRRDTREKYIVSIDEAPEKAKEIIRGNLPKMHELAKYLLEKETMTGEEFMEMLMQEV